MAKRFTDTEKWERPWFRTLPHAYRDFWLYILDKCDIAGVWYVDMELAQFILGQPLDYDIAMGFFEKQVDELEHGVRWLIRDFIAFQYVHLSPDCRPHRKVFEVLEKHGLKGIRYPIGYPISTLPGRVQDKDKDKESLSLKSLKEGGTGETNGAAPPSPQKPKSVIGQPVMREETDIQKIVKGWKILNSIPIEGPESKVWNDVHFSHYAKPAKQLLMLFGDWQTAIDAMEYVYMHLTSKKLSCTLSTIVNHSDLYREYQAGRVVR